MRDKQAGINEEGQLKKCDSVDLLSQWREVIGP